MPPESLPAASAFPWSSFGTVLLAGALVLSAFLFGGCTSIAKQLDTLPAASAQEVHYTRTGKFSNTTIIGKGYKNDGLVTTIDDLRVNHSNPWIANLEITAIGYRRLHTPPIAPPPPKKSDVDGQAFVPVDVIAEVEKAKAAAAQQAK